MDSHGGWLASATDLARFACALDDPERSPILKPASVAALFGRPPGLAGHDEDGTPKDVYYSLGWLNRVLDPAERSAEHGASKPAVRVNHGHTGSLPGTATLLILRHDRRNFVALFNARGPFETHLGRSIDPLLHQTAERIRNWPEYDLFAEPHP
jgi:N-acyl-D-amino-acid deacylase